jgi:16S rRNA (guanine527-N7)-methyltransferase
VEPIELINDAMLQSGIEISPEAMDRFRSYRSILIEWNMKINIISKNDEPRIVTRHFLQSIGLLTVFNFPTESRIMDLGTGGGFPGLPLKIVRPDLDLVLVEATQKKVIFLEEIIKILHLTRVTTFPVRAESLCGKIKSVDIIISRAVSDLRSLVRWSMPCLLKSGGILIAIKGKRVYQEIRQFQLENRSNNKHVSFRLLPYNPFPNLFVLKDSFVVIAKIGK